MHTRSTTIAPKLFSVTTKPWLPHSPWPGIGKRGVSGYQPGLGRLLTVPVCADRKRPSLFARRGLRYYFNPAFVNPSISSRDPGTVLKLMLSRFHELIIATANVNSDICVSLNCARARSYTSSLTPCSDSFVTASVHSSAARSFSENNVD